MRIAYLDCFSGISGDMTIGALLDAGLPMEALTRELAKLAVKGYSLRRAKVRRGAIAGTKFDCVPRATGRHHSHASLREIMRIIEKSALSARAKRIATSIFAVIGKAEAKVHGVRERSDLRLHELGEIDSLVDIVGTAVGLDLLGIDEVYASEVTMGRTVVDTCHGKLPVPAPAALELMKGIPSRIAAVDVELVTPTGAGILRGVSKGFGAMPRIRIRSVGYGAGSRELDGVPNMLRVIIGDTVAPFAEDTVVVIESNIDDMNPQHFGYLFERLFEEGALDVYTTTVQMKKSRPAFVLTVLSEPSRAGHLVGVVFRETTTIGIRTYETRRYALDRKSVRIRTRFGSAAVKVSTAPGIRTVTPEYEDCARLARKHNVPLKTVCDEARRAAADI